MSITKINFIQNIKKTVFCFKDKSQPIHILNFISLKNVSSILVIIIIRKLSTTIIKHLFNKCFIQFLLELSNTTSTIFN